MWENLPPLLGSNSVDKNEGERKGQRERERRKSDIKRKVEEEEKKRKENGDFPGIPTVKSRWSET